MNVIADASILIHLAAIGRFHLLKELFREIIIPEGVYSEVAIEGQGLAGSLETSDATKAGIIRVVRVTDKERTKELSETYKVSITNAEVIQLSFGEE